jgi:hypothetical protein
MHTESVAQPLEIPPQQPEHLRFRQKRTSPFLLAYDSLRRPYEEVLVAMKVTIRETGHITHGQYRERFRLRAKLQALYELRTLARNIARAKAFAKRDGN